MSDTPYYLSDTAVQEARGVPTGRMSTFDGALDTAMWVFDTARLDALCTAVARCAEAKGYTEGFKMRATLVVHGKGAIAENVDELFGVYVERDALRAEVAALRQEKGQ